MSSYLEAYGAAEEHHSRRIRLVRNVSIALAAVLLLGLILFFVFRNHSEEQQVKTFVQLLQARNYTEAYRLWGCTESHPCRDYSFQRFQEDWGPAGTHANASSAHITMSQSCGSGVVIRLTYAGSEAVPLWVERSNQVISFAPWEECPGTRHLQLGAFFRSLFHKS
ncbi:MAG TPA: hypothetical protein VMH05_18795 [Bryobacteraceae bacterium]|nr:hypothetical protein [Bryobacteraceae bacterium]